MRTHNTLVDRPMNIYLITTSYLVYEGKYFSIELAFFNTTVSGFLNFVRCLLSYTMFVETLWHSDLTGSM